MQNHIDKLRNEYRNSQEVGEVETAALSTSKLQERLAQDDDLVNTQSANQGSKVSHPNLDSTFERDEEASSNEIIGDEQRIQANDQGNNSDRSNKLSKDSSLKMPFEVTSKQSSMVSNDFSGN